MLEIRGIFNSNFKIYITFYVNKIIKLFLTDLKKSGKLYFLMPVTRKQYALTFIEKYSIDLSLG